MHTSSDSQEYVDYTDEMIRHVLLNGLYDDAIRRDVFSEANLDSMLVNELVSLVEGKELAIDATKLHPAAGTYIKKKQKEDSKTQELDRDGKCPVCSSSYKL